ncbi:MAG TPA: fatty acid desaturase family protein [Methylomirabilota bacterium]|nr:fatty acid desaturase family protein [Methylomirabilota bacterium]
MTTKHSLVQQAELARRGFTPDDPVLDQQLRALQQPRTIWSVAVLAFDWALIALAALGSWALFQTYGVSIGAVAGYLVAFLVIGSRQKGLENLMHEGTHYNLCPDRTWNDRIAVWLVGAWMTPGWSPSLERPGHVGSHHENFGVRGRDDEFFGYQRLGLGRLPAASRLEGARLIFISFARTTWWRIHGIAHSFGPMGIVAAVAVVAALYYTRLLLPFIAYWVVPYLLVYMPMRFLAEVSEHMALGHGSEFATTRNKLGWFQRYVMHPHGDGFHLVHHLYPRIPHQNLPRAHRLLLRDARYRQEGNHCGGFLSSRSGRTTLSDLLISGRSSR